MIERTATVAGDESDGGPCPRLRLQIALEDVDVVIDPLQALAPDDVDALQHLAGVDYGLGVCESVRGSDRRLAFDIGEFVDGHADAEVDSWFVE